ncbi:MAG TPA: hypothetical protein VGF87_08000 [Acidimicrobiales bacterium]|jgi:hypothetical protein
MRAFRVVTGVAAIAVVLAFVGMPGETGAAAPKASHSHSTAPLVKSTHFAFDGCRKATTVLSASMARLSYSQHQTVTVNVTVANDGSTTCGQATPSLLGGQLSIGPCGDLALIVRSGAGKNIYPGKLAIACPAIFGVSIPGHTSVSTTGSWNQGASFDSKKLAPRGTYKVSIAGKLTFTIRLTGSSNGPLPPLALAPPPEPPAIVCKQLSKLVPQCVPVRIPDAGPQTVPVPCQPQYILIATPATPVPKAPIPCNTTVGPVPSSP